MKRPQRAIIAGVLALPALAAAPVHAFQLETDSGLEAHAWLKCGELFITGESGHERYAVVSTFSWV